MVFKSVFVCPRSWSLVLSVAARLHMKPGCNGEGLGMRLKYRHTLWVQSPNLAANSQNYVGTGAHYSNLIVMCYTVAMILLHLVCRCECVSLSPFSCCVGGHTCWLGRSFRSHLQSGAPLLEGQTSWGHVCSWRICSLCNGVLCQSLWKEGTCMCVNEGEHSLLRYNNTCWD